MRFARRRWGKADLVAATAASAISVIDAETGERIYP